MLRMRYSQSHLPDQEWLSLILGSSHISRGTVGVCTEETGPDRIPENTKQGEDAQRSQREQCYNAAAHISLCENSQFSTEASTSSSAPEVPHML